jgi:PIN domain nuclease of toxin-antitoxin system
VILDTVALVRLLREALDEAAMLDLESAETLAVGAASAFEINQKVRIGKLDMRPFGEAELATLAARGIEVVPLTGEIMAEAASMVWRHEGAEHRDPFDRMIAATARARALPVLTADRAFLSLREAGLEVRLL